MKRLFKEESGFTLVELLVTMLIMITVMFALYSIFDMSLRVFSFGNDKTEAAENARLGLEKMEREIRAAYPYTKMDGIAANDYIFANFGTDPTYPVTPNPSSSITFSNDLDGDRQVDAGAEQISYSLNGGSQQTLLETASPLVEFVQPDGLTFTLCKTAESCPPSATISEKEVKLVRIEIKVKVKRGFQAGTQTFTTDVALEEPVMAVFGRFVREESGVALGLAVIMIVLIGVMGAGLLVFVRNDLTAVVDVNQGQVALETADAGVKAARDQLLAVSDPARYDGVGTDDSAWSAYKGGKNLTFEDKQMNVTVRYLPPVVSPDTPTKVQAPEVIPAGTSPAQLPGGREYFRVIVQAQAGNTRRTVEAILNTYARDVPKGYFTPGNITVNGASACISGVSPFALGNVNLPDNGNCPDGKAITGEDSAYGNWQNSVNPTPRAQTKAGIGATGTVSSKVAGRDYDATTVPKFVQSIDSAAPPGSQMRFPFDPTPTVVDLPELERIAREQGDYVATSSSSESLTSWPANSTKETVVYYKFTDGTPSNNSLKWFVPGSCSDDPALAKQGTLVVEGAAFTTQPNKARFRGVVIVREGEYVPGTADDGTSTDSGNTCLEGFVNASGNITISGAVKPAVPADLSDRPAFTGVRQWSWRECYSISCS